MRSIRRLLFVLSALVVVDSVLGGSVSLPPALPGSPRAPISNGSPEMVGIPPPLTPLIRGAQP